VTAADTLVRAAGGQDTGPAQVTRRSTEGALPDSVIAPLVPP